MEMVFNDFRQFLTQNMIPVTLGNIFGGAIFLGCIYFFLYGNESKADNKSSSDSKDTLPV